MEINFMIKFLLLQRQPRHGGEDPLGINNPFIGNFFVRGSNHTNFPLPQRAQVFRLEANNKTTPPIMEMAPRMGRHGMVCVRSVVICNGPMSMAFSMVV